MDCVKYQEIISEHLDGSLGEPVALAAESHLAGCPECSGLHEDFRSIIGACSESLGEDTAPPNPDALWRRINNIIETEIEISKPAGFAAEAARPGFFSGLWNWSLHLSPPQLVSAVLGIALLSSLLTLIGVRNFSSQEDDSFGSRSDQSLFEKAMASVGLGETDIQKAQRRVEDQKAAIEYWRKRVEVRRVMWNTDTRDVFDRNLKEIDEAVLEYSQLLEKNPQDAISNEMLDTALREKMELLREFSEL